MIKTFLYCVVAFQVIGCGYAYTDVQVKAILARYGSIFQECVKLGDRLEIEISQFQAENALLAKKTKLLNPCFVNCVFDRTKLFTTILGKKAFNVIATMDILPSFIPTFKRPNIPIREEFTKCATEYFFAPDKDEFPICGKTSVLVNCLADASNLKKIIRETIALKD